MRLKQYLTEEINRKNAKAEFKKLFSEFTVKYFPNNPHLEPKFKLRSHDKRVGYYSPKDKSVNIHPDATLDEGLFKSIVFHELIHYYDHIIAGAMSNIMHKFTQGGHGPFFQEVMGRINRKEGKDFITIKQDATKLLTIKEFYIFFAKYGTDSYAVLWSKKSIHQVPELIDMLFRFKSYIKLPWYMAKCNMKGLQYKQPLTKGTKRMKAAIVGKKEENAYNFLMTCKKEDIHQVY